MPVPTLITDLDTVAANNSPPGTEAVKGNIDNYLRTFASFIRQNYDFTQSGTGAVTRTKTDKLREVFSVDDFGAVGDGVTNDTAALRLASAAVVAGGEIVFGKGKTYLISDYVLFETAHKLTGNGSTIKASGVLLSTDSTGFQVGKTIATYSSFTPFTLTINDAAATLPVGVTASLGDLIAFKSNTVSVTGYTHGQYAIVTSVSGQDITISTPAYATYQVDSIVVYKGQASLEVSGFTFDWTGATNTVAYMEALMVRGTNIKVHGCRFLGSVYAGVGCRVEGENAEIAECYSHNFLNRQGISGAGRVGYGFQSAANNSIIRQSISVNCKHGISSAARDTTVINVRYSGNAVYEDKLAAITDYQGSLDVHSNATGNIVIENNRVVGQNALLSIRCLYATVEKNTFVQNVGTSGMYMITAFEQGFDGLILRNNSIKLAGALTNARVIGTSGASTTSLLNVTIEGNNFLSSVGNLFYVAQAGTTISNLKIKGNTFSGDSLFNLSDDTASIDGVEVIGNVCASVTTSLVRISSASANTFKNIKIERNFAKLPAAASTNVLVSFRSSGAGKDCKISGLSVRGNTLDASLDTTSGYCMQASLCVITNAHIEGNKLLRTTGNFRTLQWLSSDLTDVVISGNELDSDMLFNASALSGTSTRVRVENNILRGTFQISETSGDAIFVDCVVSNNTFKNISVTNRAGSGAWASSNELLFVDNRTTASSSTISANSTGNKIRFIGGTLYDQLIDNSSTFYAVPFGVKVLNTQISWKGGAIVGVDGRLFSELAPTTGAWVVNDVVYDPTPTASGFIGNVCVTAGTPGTWKTWGAISA